MRNDYDELVKELQKVSTFLASEKSDRQADQKRSENKRNVLQQKMVRERLDRENERAEEQMRFSDMEHEREERIRFFGLISHDLRSPLAALTLFMDVLLDKFDDIDKEEIKASLLQMQRVVSRLSLLSEALLTWTMHKLDKFQCEWKDVSLKKLVDKNIEFFEEPCKQKKISFVNTLNDSIFVCIDYDMIDAAIRNIVSNAIKYTNESGTISFNVESKKEHIILSVSDNGVGMNESRLRHLFDFTSNQASSYAGTQGERGSGMGLLLTKEFIEKSGGNIRIESCEGKGTTVFIELLICAPNEKSESV